MIPSSVVEIQKSAFSFCFELKEVEFEKNSEIKSLGDELFESSTFNVISFPDNLAELNERMLVAAGELVEIKIPPKKKKKLFSMKSNISLEYPIKKVTYMMFFTLHAVILKKSQFHHLLELFHLLHSMAVKI